METGRIPLSVERNIIQYLSKEEDRLFYFIRDLHITNVDDGLKGVYSKIKQELISLGLKKLLNKVSTGKNQFFG